VPAHHVLAAGDIKMNSQCNRTQAVLLAVFLFFAILQSAHSAQSWIAVGPNDKPASILSLAYNGKYIFAGSMIDGVGVYRSADGGKTWLKVTPRAGTQGNTIAIDPLNKSVIFVGTPNGAFRSSDDGTSWSVVQPTVGFGVSHISIEAIKGASIIYMTGTPGCWTSTDSGKTWKTMNLKVPGGELDWVAVDPNNSNHLIVGGPGLWSSSDGAQTFTQEAIPFAKDRAFSVVFDSTSPRVYATFYNNGVLRSMDSGKTWVAINNGLSGNSLYTRNILFDSNHPGRMIRASYGTGVYLSENMGGSWTSITGDLPKPQVTAILKVNGQLFAATSQGVYVTQLQ
jgi:photosystem II stability/assembly factor-like uncharacterized protein